MMTKSLDTPVEQNGEKPFAEESMRMYHNDAIMYISTVLPLRSCNVYQYMSAIFCQLSIVHYVNYAAYYKYVFMGWNGWTVVNVRTDILCIIYHKLMLYQGYLINPCFSWITNWTFPVWSEHPKALLAKGIFSKQLKSQELLSHRMPLLNNQWMYCISCVSSYHSLQQLLTLSYAIPPAVAHLESLDDRTSMALAPQAKGKWVAPVFFKSELRQSKERASEIAVIILGWQSSELLSRLWRFTPGTKPTVIYDLTLLHVKHTPCTYTDTTFKLEVETWVYVSHDPKNH